MLRFCTKSNLEKDKGYAWVIGVASFLSHFTHIGMSYGTAGNLTIAHQQFFNIDLQKGSLAGAIHVGILLMFSPLASVMIKKFGCRFTQLTGGTCILLGVALSILSRQLWHAVILYSVLAGLGVSFCYNASSVILTFHFERFKYVAFSLAMLGAYLGIVLWPLLSQYLLNNLGYSYAMGIMSTFTSINTITGILYVEPSSDNDSEKEYPDKPKELELSQASSETGADNRAVEISEEDLKVEVKLAKPVEETHEIQETKLRQEFMELLKLPKVWMFLISGMFWCATDAGFFVLINDYVVYNVSLTEYEAAFGITLLGIGNIVVCVCLVVTGSLRFNRFILYVSVIGLTSILTLITAFTNNKTMYYILTTLWGMTNGVAVTSILGFASDLCTAEQLPMLFGMECFFEGIGGIALVPLSAYISQTAGEKFGIIFIGCCGIVATFAILPIIVKSVKKHQELQI